MGKAEMVEESVLVCCNKPYLAKLLGRKHDVMQYAAPLGLVGIIHTCGPRGVPTVWQNV